MQVYLEDPCSSVMDQGGLAMHHSTRSTHDVATVRLADALVAHAHPKDWKVRPQ